MTNQTKPMTSNSELLEKTRTEADLILKLLAQSESDIQNNRTKPQAQIFSKLRASLKARVNQK